MRRTLRLMAGIAAAVLLFLMAPPANADYQSSTQTTWYSGSGVCLRTRAEAWSSFDYDSYSFAATAQAGEGNTECRYTDGPEPGAGQLAARLDVMAWTGQEWFVCQSFDWVYSEYPSYSVSASASHGYALCGATWYATVAYGARWSGAGWGGVDQGVWSGAVWVNDGPDRYSSTAGHPGIGVS